MRYHVNGDLVPAESATVSVRDRGFQYGDAAFETLRAYGGHLFEWEAHRERLGRTCASLGMPDAVPDDLRDRVRETLAANDLSDAYVRVSVTRGEQPGRLTPHPHVAPGVVVIVERLPRSGVHGESVWDGPAVVRTVETRPIPDDCLPADAKTHNYLNGIVARLELRDAATGEPTADEALLCDADGYVAEGTTSNVFFVDDGTLYTPSLDGPVLPGVTRAVVLDLAREAGVPVETGRYRLDDVLAADEVFLTNSSWEIRPVGTLDGREFGGAGRGTDEDGGESVTERLVAAFDERVERHYDGSH